MTAGLADIGYLRLRGEKDISDENFHRVWLYEELPVVCAAADHWIAAADTSVLWEDIAEESFLDAQAMASQDMGPQQGMGVENVGAQNMGFTQGDDLQTDPALSGSSTSTPAELTPHRQNQTRQHHVLTPKTGMQLARAERTAMEVVASGAGVMIMSNSAARALARKDVAIRVVEGIEGWRTGLTWLRSHDSPEIQEFIGLARGRRADSARSELPQKQDRRRRATGSRRGKGTSGAGSRGAAGRGKPSGGKSGGQPARSSGRGRPARGRRRR